MDIYIFFLYSIDTMRRKKFSGLWLTELLRRVSVFLLFVSISAMGLYVLGNYQHFLDSTQLLLLRIAGVCSIMLFFSATYFGIMVLVSAFNEKKFYVLSFVFAIISGCFGLLLFFGLRFVFSLF